MLASMYVGHDVDRANNLRVRPRDMDGPHNDKGAREPPNHARRDRHRADVIADRLPRQCAKPGTLSSTGPHSLIIQDDNGQRW